MPRRFCEATRKISFRTFSICSELIPGRMFSMSTLSVLSRGALCAPVIPDPPGILAGRNSGFSLTKLLRYSLSGTSPSSLCASSRPSSVRNTPSCTARYARSTFATPSRCNSARMAAPLSACSPAALPLFFLFVHPPLQLLAAFAFLHEFRFVGRFALGLLLLEELLNCLLHNRLYVCVFHKHLFSQAAPALRLAQRRIPH